MGDRSPLKIPFNFEEELYEDYDIRNREEFDVGRVKGGLRLKALLSTIIAFVTVWVLFGWFFNDFDEGVLVLTIVGIITGYNIGKKQRNSS